ncbi:cell division protein FtsL [Salinicoccus sp. Marseille-QA3877]
MAVERYRQAVPNTKPNDQSRVESNPETLKKSKVVGIKRGEALVYVMLMIMITIAAVFVLSSKMEAYKMQSEITNIESEIATKNGEIDELNTEVTHLASYDRIYEKAAELGLDLDNSNVKVVERHGKN